MRYQVSPFLTGHDSFHLISLGPDNYLDLITFAVANHREIYDWSPPASSKPAKIQRTLGSQAKPKENYALSKLEFSIRLNLVRNTVTMRLSFYQNPRIAPGIWTTFGSLNGAFRRAGYRPSCRCAGTRRRASGTVPRPWSQASSDPALRKDRRRSNRAGVQKPVQVRLLQIRSD
jgi:hypothetical protein